MRLVSESPTRTVSMEALGSHFSSGSWRGILPSVRVWGLSSEPPRRLRASWRNSVDSKFFHDLHDATVMCEGNPTQLSEAASLSFPEAFESQWSNATAP